MAACYRDSRAHTGGVLEQTNNESGYSGREAELSR